MSGWGILKFLNRTKDREVYEARLPGYSGEAKIDILSPTWKYISRWLEDQLRVTREKNDLMRMDELKTAALRGRIRLIKEIMELPDDS